MQKIEPVLQMSDIVEIFRVSVPTVNRWLRAARQGHNSFPLPVANGPGRKLFWSKDAIEKYLKRGSQPVDCPKIETLSNRKKRHAVAMSELEKIGISVKPQ